MIPNFTRLVTLDGDLDLRLANLINRSGRTQDDIVGEAVSRFVHEALQRLDHPKTQASDQ